MGDASCNVLSLLLFQKSQVLRTLYVGNATSANISVFQADSVRGTLTQTALIPTVTALRSIVVHPSSKFVYTSGITTPGIGQFRVSGDSLVSLGTVNGSTQNYHVPVDPTGRFLFDANGGNGDVVQYTIDQSSGLLTLNGTTAVVYGQTNWGIYDPQGRFLYTSDAAAGAIDRSAINSNGTLGSPSAIATTAGAGFLILDPTGRFVYTAGSNVFAHSLQSDGSLVSLGSQPCGSPPNGISADSQARNLYVSEPGGTVCVFSISGSGALTLIDSTIAGTSPSGVFVEPGDRFVYVINNGSNDLYMYARSSSGRLTFLRSYPTGTGPNSLAAITASDF